MTKADFLADSHIQGFSYWVAQRFNCSGNWRHSYGIRDSGARCTFTSLADAFRQYEWNGKPWSENFGELTTYRRQLRTAIATSNGDAAFAVCEAVLRWGGVWANNGRTLAARQPLELQSDPGPRRCVHVRGSHAPQTSDDHRSRSGRRARLIGTRTVVAW